MLHKLGWALTGALALLAVLALARATVAGPLDPPGPVGSTMRTLDELVPSWGKSLTSAGGCASQRFQCVLALNAAVLDRETGLVWQRVPSTQSFHYAEADLQCSQFTETGGRAGWRLPTLLELQTLIDTSSADSLPAGHPFSITTDVYFWTQTADAVDSQFLQTLTFLNGGGGISAISRPRTGGAVSDQSRAWCVRGQTEERAQLPDEHPAWSRKLEATGGCVSARFECVMNGVAVLDRETGLVWQQAPRTVPDSWSNALSRCDEREYGGRLGWRLPEAFELASLVDPSVAGSVKLPLGHPFDLSGGTTVFWTTSAYGGGSAHEAAYFQGVNAGSVGVVYVYISTAETNRYWCVRGGAGGYPE